MSRERNVYRFRITADVEVRADNVAQARKIAKRMRLVGQCAGAERPRNNRDMLPYAVELRAIRVAHGEGRDG